MQRKLSIGYWFKGAELILFLVFFTWGCGLSAQKGLPHQDYTPWYTYLSDARRSNHNGDDIFLPPQGMWMKDISPVELFKPYPPEQSSSPAISGGAIYIGSTNRKVYSLDLRRGKVVWRFKAGSPVESPPSVSEEMVCFGTSDGILYCLERKTGKELWHYQAKSEIISSPIIHNHRVYFASSDNRIYAIDGRSGKKVWSYARPQVQTVYIRLHSSPAISGGRLYHTFSDGYLVCLSLDNGRELWKKEIFKDFRPLKRARRTPLVYDGYVYIVDEGGSVVGLDARTGMERTRYSPHEVVDFVVLRDTVLLAGRDSVTALNRVTGTILWQVDLPYTPVENIFAVGGYLFVLANHESAPLGLKFLSEVRGYVQALHIATGEMVWSDKLIATVTASGSGAENHIALFTNKGVVQVMGTR